MSTYLELKAQLATLDLKIEIARATEKANAILAIRAKMDEWQIDARDLQFRRPHQPHKQSRNAR